jgi:hypothetical protein
MGTGFRTPDDTLLDVQESKRRLLLFVVKADEALSNVREFARRLEQQMDTLFRVDAPSLPQKPHFRNERTRNG